MQPKVRTRFAPSPTGRVHIGSIQKIVYSYALAKKYGGDYILRVEDTDRKRFVAGSEAEFYTLHQELGIELSESPHNPGKYGPYRQSERLDLYQQYARELVEKGYAYYAFETAEELVQMRSEQQANKQRPRYQGRYRDLPLAEADKLRAAGKPHVVRIKTPPGQTVSFDDMIMGQISFQTDELDDYVLLKSDGYPTYHLAVVVDDHLMEISHVFRGVEWIATAPIHILLYQFLGWEIPQLAHIPNILDPNGGKLSKRSGSVAALDFFASGYLPAAVLNFIILLGWSPKTDQEMIGLDEFIKLFDVAKFNKSNPVFNRDKLNWFNEQYIRRLSASDFIKTVTNWVERYQAGSQISEIIEQLTPEQLTAALTLEQERITLLGELPAKLASFVQAPTNYDFEHKFLRNLQKQQLTAILEEYLKVLATVDLNNWNHNSWESEVRQIADKLGLKAREVFMCLRIAITGSPSSPPLFEFAQIIGITAERARINQALTELTK